MRRKLDKDGKVIRRAVRNAFMRSRVGRTLGIQLGTMKLIESISWTTRREKR